MGFIIRWLFRGLIVWLGISIMHSCGSTKIYSDDVPAPRVHNQQGVRL